MFRSWARSFLAREGIDDPGALGWLVEADGDGYTPKRALFELVRLRWGLDRAADELVEQYQAEYAGHVRLGDEIAIALRVLRDAGCRLGIVTNGAPSQVDKIERCGLAALVDGWAISETEGVAKPDRRLFELAASRAGGSLDGAWMVGDHPVYDVGGGRDAGCTTVWVHRDRTWELTSYRPDHIVTTAAEVVTLVCEPDVYLPNIVFGG